MHRSGERVAEALIRHLPRIAHVRMAPGPYATGAVDHESMLVLLDRIGYRARIGCARPISGGREESLEWLRRHGLERRQAISYAPVSAPRRVAAA
jgi:hydroxypyruvate isomerase